MEIVILDSGYKSYAFESELFRKNGYELKIYPGYKGQKSGKIAFSKNADGILVRHTIIDEEFLSEMKNLKAVVRYGVGYDNINIEACSRHNVKAANVQGYANHAVSDHALALIFSCARALWNPGQQLITSFATPPAEDVIELHEKTLGIIGVGRIGSELCIKAKNFFKEVTGCDPYIPESHFRQLSIRRVGLDELLECSDVISLHCNLTPETRYILDAEQFNMMKRRPIIINTSRGEVIREKALLEALNSAKVHSAGLDVYEDEPVTEKQSGLTDHPRTICTGHYAWYSERSMPELQRRAALNLLNLLKGVPVEDGLN
jgi:D-3-phosphoglycerate dehydrogenase